METSMDVLPYLAVLVKTLDLFLLHLLAHLEVIVKG